MRCYQAIWARVQAKFFHVLISNSVGCTVFITPRIVVYVLDYENKFERFIEKSVKEPVVFTGSFDVKNRIKEEERIEDTHDKKVR